MDDNHISKEDFLFDFFGNYGREFGNPRQWFVNDPTLIYSFIEDCKIKKIPAFMSVQPRSAHYKVKGIEKIFFDFDYADKFFIKNLDIKFLTEEAKNINKNESEYIKEHFDKSTKIYILNDEHVKQKEEILIERKNALPFEVKRFINKLINPEDSDCYPLTPLTVKTNKGYHVYIYFDTIYEIDEKTDFWCEVYGTLFNQFFKNGFNYRFIDTSSSKDLFRMSRIPFSIHEKSGLECVLVDNNLNSTKIRGLGYQKMGSLKRQDLLKAVKLTHDILRKKELKYKKEKTYNDKKHTLFNNRIMGIRPCFKQALDYKEMPHKMRLAMLLELWFRENKHEYSQLVDAFRVLNDFKEEFTSNQVKWFLDNKIYEKFVPYSCKTIIKENWCLQDKCYKYKYIGSK